MPELPEVETVRRGLCSLVEGAQIVDARITCRKFRILIPEGLEQSLKGRRILSIGRRAKYLLLELDGGGGRLVVHLGMSGKFFVRNVGQQQGKHEHVTLRLADGREIIFQDARRFGLFLPLTEEHAASLLEHLGPEPFAEDFSADYLAQSLARKGQAIKIVLMDQELVVGVGNIYASEVLFRTSINPATPARDCVHKAAELVCVIREVLQEAIEAGGSTLRDYANASGDSGYFQHNFKVYGRAGESCVVCASKIESIRQGGRSSFFCPACQK